MHTMELCSAFIHAGLKQYEKINSWIREGDFDSSRLYFPTKAFLNIVYGRTLLINEEYMKLLGRSDQFLEEASIFPNLLGQIYSYIHIAAANVRIYRHKEALLALTQAMKLAMPDKMDMPFVENCDYIIELVRELGSSSDYSEAVARIIKLYNTYKSSKELILKEHFAGELKPELTQREHEIGMLAAEGLTNKEIGDRLYISVNTVKVMLKSIYNKLSINNRVLLKQHFQQN
jgi:LuxR family transcriptional regulator, maltose regulon positive regulatory protein